MHFLWNSCNISCWTKWCYMWVVFYTVLQRVIILFPNVGICFGDKQKWTHVVSVIGIAELFLCYYENWVAVERCRFHYIKEYNIPFNRYCRVYTKETSTNFNDNYCRAYIWTEFILGPSSVTFDTCVLHNQQSEFLFTSTHRIVHGMLTLKSSLWSSGISVQGFYFGRQNNRIPK